MANLAIKGVRGNNLRGWKVIKTLEMLGGVNRFNLEGNTSAWYVLEEGRTIRWSEWIFEEKGFTLEEFLEKFPYKVGDRVRVPEYESEVYISKMHWDGNEVQYEVVTDEVEWYSAKELNEFNEPNKEETAEKENYNPISLLPVGDKIMIVPTNEDSEIIEENGKIYLVKKQPKYPKTYEECHKLMAQWKECDCNPNSELILCDAPIHEFCKLIVARNIYWKIAGEQLGLGKPWHPDYIEESYEQGCPVKYIIYYTGTNIIKERKCTPSYLLSFPTEEMRDAFFENFGYLIELCKDLL